MIRSTDRQTTDTVVTITQDFDSHTITFLDEERERVEDRRGKLGIDLCQLIELAEEFIQYLH